MKIIEKIKNKKTLILGFGREGQSTYRFIRNRYPDRILAIADKKEITNFNKEVVNKIQNDSNLVLHLGKKYLSCLGKYDLIIKSPGIPYKFKEIKKAGKKGIEITSHTNIFLEECAGKVIGITGTKGKSTTSSLIYHILQDSGASSNLIGNIGKPALDYLNGINEKVYFVFEMSSHQLYDIARSPQIAVLLNIFREHLDYYKNYQEYIEAKGNITKFQKTEDIFVYNEDFPEIIDIADKTMAKKYSFSNNHIVKQGCYFEDDNIVFTENKCDIFKFNTSDFPLLGRHNFANIMAAIVVAQALRIDIRKIKKALTNFEPLEGRLEKVGVYKYISFVNDTLATIPEAAIAAVNSFGDKKITLILGGYDRGIPFDLLAKSLVRNKNVLNVILIGQTGERIGKDLEKYMYKGNIYNLSKLTMKEIVKLSAKITPIGGVVLLSPASPSFDMFKDYKDRGNQFKEVVKHLSKAS